MQLLFVNVYSPALAICCLDADRCCFPILLRTSIDIAHVHVRTVPYRLDCQELTDRQTDSHAGMRACGHAGMWAGIGQHRSRLHLTLRAALISDLAPRISFRIMAPRPLPALLMPPPGPGPDPSPYADRSVVTVTVGVGAGTDAAGRAPLEPPLLVLIDSGLEVFVLGLRLLCVTRLSTALASSTGGALSLLAEAVAFAAAAAVA